MDKNYFSVLFLLQLINLLPITIPYNQNYNYLASSSWKHYGPLSINIMSLRYKNNSHIYQAYNSNSKPIYIAINCPKKTINVTNQRLEWKGWEPPFKGFEFSILNDLCKLP